MNIGRDEKFLPFFFVVSNLFVTFEALPRSYFHSTMKINEDLFCIVLVYS